MLQGQDELRQKMLSDLQEGDRSKLEMYRKLVHSLQKGKKSQQDAQDLSKNGPNPKPQWKEKTRYVDFTT